jgi:hypothetical protein
LKKNGDQIFPLHPILGALTIVIRKNEDFGNITASHPGLKNHKYYNPNAEFPADISNMLPPMADRWWESLGMRQLLKFQRCPAYSFFFNKKLKPLAKSMLPKTAPQTLVLLRLRRRARASS